MTAASTSQPESAWTAALQSIDSEQLRAPLTPLHGRVPDGLRGTFYRNGPARHVVGGRRYHHWFDADGMVQAFRFTDGGVHHHGRFVDTHKHTAETAAGERLYPAFGTPVPDARMPGPDEHNAANTNVLPHHGRLLALWEGGSAHALDPATLDTHGPVAWSEATAGTPFSAHPRVEPDGTLWNFGMNAWAGELVLYEISPGGELRRTQRIGLPDGPPMVHDFAVTERHLVILMPPLHFKLDRLQAGWCFLDSHVWEPETGMRALVVDKADLAPCRWFDLPAGFVFHLGGAWDDGDAVRVDYDRYGDPGIVTDFARDIMTGDTGTGAWPHSTAVQAVLDLTRGTANQTVLVASGTEFPAMHPDRVGQRYRHRYAVGSDGAHTHPFQNAVQRIDLETGRVERFSFGPDVITEEHAVVPKPGASHEADAWLVGTVVDVAARQTRLTVFDAASLSDGPVYEGALPYALPLGFHGNFAPA